jgi:hypothetical protein
MSAKLIVKKFFSTELVIDDVALKVRVPRMTNREFDAFAKEFAEYGTPRGPAESEPLDQAALREERQREWIRRTLGSYLVIEPGELQDESGRDVPAPELLDLYGGRTDVVPQALGLIFAENHVSEAKKKTFRLLLVSSLGSVAESRLAALGGAPEPTVESVAPPSSVPPVAATDEPSDASSGTTAAIPAPVDQASV